MNSCKMPQTSVLIALLIVTSFIVGCDRKEPAKVEPAAGKGGKATLRITAKHHGRVIDSATIYIKYNEQNTPSSYDDSVKMKIIDGKSIAIFSELRSGKYYLLGSGWDTTILGEVRGGLPYTINDEKAYDISLPVTEGD